MCIWHLNSCGNLSPLIRFLSGKCQLLSFLKIWIFVFSHPSPMMWSEAAHERGTAAGGSPSQPLLTAPCCSRAGAALANAPPSTPCCKRWVPEEPARDLLRARTKDFSYAHPRITRPSAEGQSAGCCAPPALPQRMKLQPSPMFQDSLWFEGLGSVSW